MLAAVYSIQNATGAFLWRERPPSVRPSAEMSFRSARKVPTKGNEFLRLAACVAFQLKTAGAMGQVRITDFAVGARAANQSGCYADPDRGDEGAGARGISTKRQIAGPARRRFQR
jgi:hypothetical protein